MDHPPNIRPRRPGRHLKSVAGAFDLPSILVGVVVVGILTAGVLAAIFGVIPFAQVNAAKQDLAAINTAQGVTYAQDDQMYKDLAGLEDADLVSGLDSETTEVTTSAAGKGFTAIVTAANGEKWFITHDDPAPRKWAEHPADLPATPAGLNTAAWASEYCTPVIIDYVMITLGVYTHPGMIESLKAQNEQPYDQDLLVEVMEIAQAPIPDMTHSEGASSWDLARVAGLTEMYQNIMNNMNLERYPAARDNLVVEMNAAMMNWCHNYPGPGETVPNMTAHTSRPETFEPDPWVDAEYGSTQPIVMGFTLPGTADDFTVTYDLSQIPGAVGTPRYEILDGTPYWSLTLDPGSAGWSYDNSGLIIIKVNHADDDFPEWRYSGYHEYLTII